MVDPPAREAQQPGGDSHCTSTYHCHSPDQRSAAITRDLHRCACAVAFAPNSDRDGVGCYRYGCADISSPNSDRHCTGCYRYGYADILAPNSDHHRHGHAIPSAPNSDHRCGGRHRDSDCTPDCNAIGIAYLCHGVAHTGSHDQTADHTRSH